MCRDAFRNFHFNRSLSRNSDVDGAGGRIPMPLVPTQEDAIGFLRGITNGDDAVVSSPYYIGVADGVGAWNTRPQGHAALWSRLILHFWALETEQQVLRFNSCNYEPLSEDNSLLSPISALQASYETSTAITKPFPFLGTTTACLALLLPPTTLLLTNVGDSQAFVFRPSEGKFIARTEEQWHWFDCPRQLGTNSPDTPEGVGKVVDVQVEEGDLVLVATDGLVDNLWEAEIVRELTQLVETGEKEEQMAEKLVQKAKSVAEDPWGLSPYMERAVEQGLGIEGGKWDDISVVIARCQRRPEEN
ncbi:protein serine/threonine phosphatase 2C [Terfezia boudieri ATCC MYA-4762]|uniref:Protein phosphatase n=1 Tax=Terfezia boudieri ATCC MYA-4762 TaxID=1051890 RepID=A0A3N4M027_9PEZI|nr:protein serine/threonine phosphatase 2C [Terfezia boudieri ATCC MYA-4762]